MAGEYDLKITAAGGFDFAPDGEPRFLSGSEVVAQDLAHRIREKGLALGLVAEDEDPAPVLGLIKTEVEEDTRIKPGTARVEVVTPGTVEITANTMDGGQVSLTVAA